VPGLAVSQEPKRINPVIRRAVVKVVAVGRFLEKLLSKTKILPLAAR
jgi:hypothetical protein